MRKLYTERQGGTAARVAETLSVAARRALLTLIVDRMDDEWFGYTFPQKCGDGYRYAGTDLAKLKERITGLGLLWPRDVDDGNPPSDGVVFGLVEFAYEIIAEPRDPSYHSYMGHTHYDYDQLAGRTKYAHDVNRIFERHGVAFELQHGEVTRLAPAVLHQALTDTVFNTGDAALDGLLETARNKFLNRDLVVRREALEKLWDAWERLKTVEPGKDKKARANAILNKAVGEPTLRARVETDASELTAIGNDFTIRHTETSKTPIAESAHVDYHFHRLFALILLLLKGSGRAR